MVSLRDGVCYASISNATPNEWYGCALLCENPLVNMFPSVSIAIDDSLDLGWVRQEVHDILLTHRV